jgi:hypothetical protein
LALRGFGIQTLTGTAQPAFGTTLSSAITNLTTDPHTGRTDPASQLSLASAVVVNANFFRVGDSVNIGPAAGPYDWAKITKITAGTPPAATLTLQGLTSTHASAQFVILAIPCAQLYLFPGSANSGTFYIGEDSTVSSTSATLIRQITAAQALAGLGFVPSTSSSGGMQDTPHLWVTGTSADTYLPSILMI